MRITKSYGNKVDVKEDVFSFVLVELICWVAVLMFALKLLLLSFIVVTRYNCAFIAIKVAE